MTRRGPNWQTRVEAVAGTLVGVVGVLAVAAAAVAGPGHLPAKGHGPSQAADELVVAQPPPTYDRPTPSTTTRPSPTRAPSATASAPNASASATSANATATSASANAATKPRAPTDGGYGCGPALAYLAAHQAPGFTDICAPLAAGSGRAGRTISMGRGDGSVYGTVYISCPAPIVYMNEASNSNVMAGRSAAPIDPYGGVPISQCHSGDIAP